MAIHSSILAWKIPWTEEPGGLHSPWGRKESDMTEQLSTHTHTHVRAHTHTHTRTHTHIQWASEFGIWPGFLLCVCVCAWVYICVCAYVYMYVAVNIYDCVCVWVCGYLWECICVRVGVSVSLCVCECMYMCLLCVWGRLVWVPSLFHYNSQAQLLSFSLSSADCTLEIILIISPSLCS